MSWSTCYSGSNNINFNFPPIMADGRNYATWQPDAVVNERIQDKEGIKSNWSYRQYLQRNGLQVINYNSTEACYTLGLDPHVKSDRTPSDNVPYKFKNVFDFLNYSEKQFHKRGRKIVNKIDKLRTL